MSTGKIRAVRTKAKGHAVLLARSIATFWACSAATKAFSLSSSYFQRTSIALAKKACCVSITSIQVLVFRRSVIRGSMWPIPSTPRAFRITMMKFEQSATCWFIMADRFAACKKSSIISSFILCIMAGLVSGVSGGEGLVADPPNYGSVPLPAGWLGPAIPGFGVFSTDQLLFFVDGVSTSGEAWASKKSGSSLESLSSTPYFCTLSRLS